MNKDAARFFAAQLNTEEGRRPAATCGGGRCRMRRSGISGWDMRRAVSTTGDYLKKLGYTEEELLAGGIVKRSQRGGTYDFSTTGSSSRSSICGGTSSRSAAGGWGRRADPSTSTAGTHRF